MKVGEYVRTIKGIGKIEKIETDKQDTIVYLDSGITIDYITKDFTEEEINKMYPSSSKIIKLIEVGDYVNGEKVGITIDTKELAIRNTGLIYDKPYNLIKDIDIKSIVTKEQFKAMEYKCE